MKKYMQKSEIVDNLEIRKYLCIYIGLSIYDIKMIVLLVDSMRKLDSYMEKI